MVASPEYLRRNGLPKIPEEVNQHQAVLPSYADLNHVEITHRNGDKALLELKPIIKSNNTLMYRKCKLIQVGCGIGYLREWTICQDLENGLLVRLLPDYHIFGVQLNAAYVERSFLSAKVRSMIDFLSEKIEEDK